jgi:tRNA-dihydrouridine synthase 1
MTDFSKEEDAWRRHLTKVKKEKRKKEHKKKCGYDSRAIAVKLDGVDTVTFQGVENEPQSDHERKRRKKEKQSKSDTDSKTATLPVETGRELDTRYILAPMVGASELAFRLLCRRYGATLAYTPMINSDRFVADEAYRKQEFQTTPADRPLVAHFSANHPKTFLKAAKLVEGHCDAIDLNLGCPQRVAFVGHFGSFLLAEEDRALLLKIVRKVSQNISIPLFAKIRLLDTVEDTIRLCQQLRDAGIKLIAIHARHRVNLAIRTGPGARHGPAMLDQVKAVKEAITDIPIISNGNVRTFNDVMENLKLTRADGIMSAEGILDNPALFSGELESATMKKLDLAKEYLQLIKKHPAAMKTVVFHLRRMCRQELTSYQLLDELLQAKTMDDVEKTMGTMFQYSKFPETFTYDPDKQKKQKAALERKKFEEGKRKRFEGRMQRKAKREGKPLDFYLKDGLEPPTVNVIASLKSKGKEEAFALWSKSYKQHCFAFHFETSGCKRDRACAFLHFDLAAASHEDERSNEMQSFG